MTITTIPVGELATNCYLLQKDDASPVVLIDPGADPESILRAVHGRPVAAILLTHGHFDHIGAVDALPEAPLYIHELDAEMLMDGRKNGAYSLGFEGLCRRKAIPVREGDTFTPGGIVFTVLHTPGHTRGSVTYQTEDALFTGDTLFHRGYGRTDLYGGSYADIRVSLRRLLSLPPALRFYPGHGPSATLEQER